MVGTSRRCDGSGLLRCLLTSSILETREVILQQTCPNFLENSYIQTKHKKRVLIGNYYVPQIHAM